MPHNLENTSFSLHHFRFHLEPEVPLHMPAYNKGSVIRGGFGSTFRRIVCHANCREPEICELRNVCPYTAVFQPFVPEGSEKISKNRDIPRPFVIKPPMLKADGAQARRPAFGPIAKRLRDRINALSYFYCGKGLDIDFKAFGEQADGIKIVADSTRWVESSRYSRRREVTHDLSGFVGEVSFEGGLAPFMPYLKLGEYVHVGKNAVFGNGWYQIVHVD